MRPTGITNPDSSTGISVPAAAGGAVAATQLLDNSTVKTIGTVWTDLANFTVPAGDHEVYFVEIQLSEEESTGESAYYQQLGVKLVIDGIEYPAADGMGKIVKSPPLASPLALPVCFLFTIPKNITGGTVYIQGKAGGLSVLAIPYWEAWGHSPHVHVPNDPQHTHIPIDPEHIH